MLEQMYEVCKGEDLACSNEILNRMGQYSMVIDTVDNITKVRNTMVIFYKNITKTVLSRNREKGDNCNRIVSRKQI